ncbi:MAG: DUF192 domain-containing protein [Woeseiaceae bacterium]|nr:DUF192 domain-containing protein [Woeseiaceae bacterium]
MTRRLFALALLLPVCGMAEAAGESPDLDAFFPRSDLIIVASRPACYHFGVHMAVNSEQWRRGLMHVRDLDPWRGMLFVYGEEAPRSMWMKNTFIPLDILFVRADGRIATIARDTEPLSLRSIPSGEPVQYVLELNAGTAARLGIATGDRLVLFEVAPF